MKRLSGTVLAVIVMAVLQGCATPAVINPENSSAAVDKRVAADPFERFNRAMFKFNDGVDQAVIKPVAIAYREVTPEPVRKGVTNFFANISDGWSFINNTLQLKGVEATDSLFRFTVNTVWGLGGILDVASDMNIGKHTEDFGQTLGYWGVPPGPYVVLPMFGPSTVRDSVGSLVDVAADPVSSAENVSARNSLMALRLVNLRANFLQAGDVLEQAALDKYTFSREIYLQRRRALVGRESEKEERYDLPDPAAVEQPAGAAADAPADAPAEPAK
ncbi:MAG: VacJ family lipoprotein [Pseudomonadota bacterium]